MNIKKSRQLKTALFVALLSATLYAAVDFNPATMPTVTIAPYALKNLDLSTANNHAYRPWFENGAWQGDLIEYDLAIDGTRTTDADVGSNPPVASGNNWMARAVFAAKENPSGDGQTFTTYWQEGVSGRNIFTVGSTGNQADFLWSNLSDAQKTALDAETFALATNGAYDSPILNFVRGDRSNEKGQGGTYRDRFSLLGDIVNSYPVYIGPARETFTITGYPVFKDSVASRPGRVAVGSNGGALHVFDAVDGSEVYAYVPSMLFGNLAALKALPYKHTYYVDGQITVASANNGGTWMSVLSGTLGAGAKGLYALNITNPDMSADKVLFEKTGSDIGYILGRPRIARKTDGKWYIVTGNGINSASGVAKLLMFELNGSTYTQTELSTGAPGGLSAPVLVDTNKDFKADLAFAGDTNGDMWKFYLGSSPPATNPEKIFDGNPNRPILTAPAVTAHPSSGYMVLWATGSSLSLAEAADTSYPPQAVYGIWDSAIGDVMVTQVMLEEANADFSPNTETVRYIDTNNTVDYTCAANDATCAKGWRVQLPNTGERVLGPVQVRAGRVTMMSSTPLGTDPDSTDLVGDSWLISLSYFTGGDDGDVVYNLNGDSAKDDLDKVDVGGGGTPDLRPPVGLHLGDGNLSQPRIARLEGGTDIMYINGLRLPLPQLEPDDGPFLTGHIDVETDSPSGGSIAPNIITKHSELFNIETSDGLGKDIDGHFHEYDTVNNVHYVDLFELEPRRGQASAAAVLTGDAPCDTTTPNGKEIQVGSKCLQAIEGELNRAYDTLQTDRDGNPEASVEAEVYALGTATPLANDQKFIIVVANGDLTPAAELQIGCRTWDIVEYENMVTSQLEAGREPDDMDDTVHGITSDETLVFTLDEIASGSADGQTCPGNSPNPTVRLRFSTRDILDGAIHGTRSQCVLGLHDYHDPVDYWDDEVLCWAPDHLGYNPGYGAANCSGIVQPPAGYIKDPDLNLHITELPSKEGVGFRWRNGALTLQFLRVDSSGNQDYTLQHPAFLPTRGAKRFGGTHAQAYTDIKKVVGVNYPTSFTSDLAQSGLLYESTAYWHFGDLADEVQRADPASIPCYGDPDWSSAFTQETRGLNLGQYQALYEDIDADLLALYDAAVLALEAALAGDDQAAIEAALLVLAELLTDADLAYYHRFRDYAPGVIPEQHLREIDKDRVPPPDGDDGGSSTDDGIPVDVVDLEDLDTEVVGPNFTAGRRTWIDLRR